ncbi:MULTISPECIES: FAD-dependent oxidoreductase [Rhodobacterales]|uniref:FAD-dependent oxidoreductase n=1 Tax=Cognatishimia coralii TaxID=3083254 RepID=A0ABU8QKD9_9RHOB|nr:FAD-dependent oxidoreductase [Shimia aestuarii]
MPNYEPLFRPFKIKSVTIRNRVMSTAHTSGASEDGKPKEKYQAYQEEKARGGIGLTIIGGSTAVAPDSPGADMLHLDASSDDIIPYYDQLADRIHKHGATVFAQIAHMGRRANWDNDKWLPPISPSGIREAAHRSFPKVMEDWDIQRVVKAFAQSARRVQAGGMDGLELSATHNQLFDQFWSPKTNLREDAYGGSFENRMRFTFEVIDAIRVEVGDDFPLGLRMSGDELLDGGMTHEDLLRVASALAEHGQLDYLGVLGGSAENLPSHSIIFPGMEMPAAPFLSLAAAVKHHTGLPVFHAQRLADVATAARAIEEGHIDMAAMTRPHIADPHIVRKLQDGREDQIRPCVGANYCIDRLYAGGQALCLHSPATGREQSMPHDISKAVTVLRAVVVGAGPAGLEAARVLGLRGHNVTLFEKKDQTGGQVRLAAALSWRSPLLAITDWLEARVREIGIDIRLSTTATVEEILSLNPDLVIVATGGRDNDEAPIPGVSLATTPWDILMNGATDFGSDPVMVFDDNGGEQALSAAEALAKSGAKVHFVTADPTPGVRLERTTRPTFFRRLYDHGVEFHTNQRLKRIVSQGNALKVTIENEYNGSLETQQLSGVVVDYGTRPNDQLYFDLKSSSTNLGAVDLGALVQGTPQNIAVNEKGEFKLFRIGDAVSGRNIHAAIFDALRLCKDL